ncbi:MAG: hypothetical protein WCD67_07705 [Xanthobacteraceae bacterium]
MFLAQNVYKRIAIVILQHGKIEISRFRFDDMLRELHHLGGQLHVRNAAEILPHLVRKAQRHPAQPVIHRRDQHRPLAGAVNDGSLMLSASR